MIFFNKKKENNKIKTEFYINDEIAKYFVKVINEYIKKLKEQNKHTQEVMVLEEYQNVKQVLMAESVLINTKISFLKDLSKKYYENDFNFIFTPSQYEFDLINEAVNYHKGVNDLITEYKEDKIYNLSYDEFMNNLYERSLLYILNEYIEYYKYKNL